MKDTDQLNHIAKCTSQYDSTCRELAQELLRAHALAFEVAKYALEMGETWRIEEGAEIMDALQAFEEER